jgi:uncharacterized protein (DUF302 family)
MERPFFALESPRSFANTCSALERAVPAHGFGLLSTHDLGQTLRSKGQAFSEECRVFELCQPQQAARVLAAEMLLSTALPCRISVFTEGGRTTVAMVRPEGMLRALSSDPALAAVAAEVEAATVAIIREAVGQP